MRIGARKAGDGLAFAALLLLALLIRMAVPPGYMLAPGAGAWPVVPCDGFGPAPPPAAPDAHAAHSGHDMAHGGHHAHQAPPGEDAPEPTHKTDHPCAFGGLAAGVVAPVVPAVVLPVLVPAVMSVFRFAEIMAGRGLAAPPPPQTGPPTGF